MNETEEGREQTRKWIKEIYEWGGTSRSSSAIAPKKKKNKLVYRLLRKERGKDANRGKLFGTISFSSMKRRKMKIERRYLVAFRIDFVTAFRA